MSLTNQELSYDDFFHAVREASSSHKINRVMKYFEKDQVDPKWFNRRSINTWSPFELALICHSATLLRTFLDKGASPQKDPKQLLSDRTPLILTSENNNFELFEILLQYGADPNFSEKNMIHPLAARIRRGSYEDNENWVRAMLDHGADVHAITLNNKTAYELACQSAIPQWKILLDTHLLRKSTPQSPSHRSSPRL